MYSLRCLAQTSTGVVEGNIFWDQAIKFTSILVKATPSTPSTSSSIAEDRVTSLVLHAFDTLVEIAETRSDKDIFMAVEEKGKNFIAFCDYWSSFARRVDMFSLDFVLVANSCLGWRYLALTKNQHAHAKILSVFCSISRNGSISPKAARGRYK
jgi:hypothetical protein